MPAIEKEQDDVKLLLMAWLTSYIAEPERWEGRDFSPEETEVLRKFQKEIQASGLLDNKEKPEEEK